MEGERERVGERVREVEGERERVEGELERVREALVQRETETEALRQELEGELERVKSESTHHLKQVHCIYLACCTNIDNHEHTQLNWSTPSHNTHESSLII